MLSHNTDDLKKAMNAYNFAEAKSKAAGYPVVSPDLLYVFSPSLSLSLSLSLSVASHTSSPYHHRYNRATVYKFQEKYQEALDGFRKAMQADPSLTQAMTDAEDVVKLVARVAGIYPSLSPSLSLLSLPTIYIITHLALWSLPSRSGREPRQAQTQETETARRHPSEQGTIARQSTRSVGSRARGLGQGQEYG
eukprot:TRINITY_DN2101_c1_g1_i5.p1 TRINITY_DN2101_c1_g1~~TRINITY_DN2101_c1_g1_i5.p1  ORF type:complete len:193 (-),score=37.74 TRINITY_DN2101_c1_g1_i5:536-1114(-)